MYLFIMNKLLFHQLMTCRFLLKTFSGLAKSTDFPNLELGNRPKALLQLVESNKSGSRRFVPIFIAIIA